MALAFLDQLQIFWRLHLIELLGILTSLGLLKLSTEFGMMVFFTNLSLMEF